MLLSLVNAGNKRDNHRERERFRRQKNEIDIEIKTEREIIILFFSRKDLRSILYYSPWKNNNNKKIDS